MQQPNIISSKSLKSIYVYILHLHTHLHKKPAMQTHHIIKLEYSDLGKHSSEIRGLCSMKCFSKKCLKFCNILRTTKKTPIIFFILCKFTFSSMNVQVYVDIDQRAMIREKIKLYKMNRQQSFFEKLHFQKVKNSVTHLK